MTAESREISPAPEIPRRAFVAAALGSTLRLGWDGVQIYGLVKAWQGLLGDQHETPEGRQGNNVIDCEQLSSQTIEVPADASPERQAVIITEALNMNNKVRGVRVAIDHELLLPPSNDAAQTNPIRIVNPIVLGEGAYGAVTYNRDTGVAQATIMPSGGVLEAVRNTRYEPGQPVSAEISRIFTEDTRDFYTAISQEPGCIPTATGIELAGRAIFSE